ncbi:MAG: hypothetical protein P8J20_04290 [Novosphingobium sp.]|nr:hypothetical protein [Novosphingobium sp.]
MRIIFSRKGFDSSSGGCPSPIVDGRPISLPIPKGNPGDTRYEALGLGEAVEQATRGKIAGTDECHDDPLFAEGHCWFGQCDAAQGHLSRNGVRQGDVFVFFGLFADEHDGERHHRIFGHMRITAFGSPEELDEHRDWRAPPRAHPHLSGQWPANNCIYFGPGSTANAASPALRLTRPGGPLNRWIVPSWLQQFGLTYHARPERWIGERELDSVKRGQEFICDIGDAQEPRQWLRSIISQIEA